MSDQPLIKKITLGKLDIQQIKDNPLIICIGMRNSGKSTIVLDYLSQHQDIPCGIVISPTEQFNLTYQNHLPQMFIHEEMNTEILESFIKRQEYQVIKASQDPTIDPRAFIVLDDCMADFQSWTNNKAIQKLFFEKDRLNVTLIITLMDPVGIPARLRNCIDYIFLCKNTNKTNCKRLFQMYGQMFPDQEHFRATMLNYCDNFNKLVIHQTVTTATATTDGLKQQVFYYKANWENTRSFKICHQKYWEYQENIQQGMTNSDEI